MNQKKFYNKMPSIILCFLILNLLLGDLFLPLKAMANCGRDLCYSCNPETRKCEKDPSGNYSCRARCDKECSGSDSTNDNPPPSPSYTGCGGKDPIPVYITGSVEEQKAQKISETGIESLNDIANVTNMAKQTLQELLNKIKTGIPLSETEKTMFDEAINNLDIPQKDRDKLINIVNSGLPIPEEFQKILNLEMFDGIDLTNLI